MRIFEEGGPLDPVEEPERTPFRFEYDVPQVPVERGRSLGVLSLVVVDLVLGGLAVGSLFFLWAARAYLLKDSPDFGSEMSDALIGLRALITAGGVLAGGFLLSALGVFSLTRIGYRIQALWAILLCATVAGLAYGLPVLLFLRRRATHARFFA